MLMKRNDFSVCPCCSGNHPTLSKASYALCCRPLLEGEALAETAEQLMRSRYTAFVEKNETYLLSTWHPDNRPVSIEFDKAIKWLGLKIKKTRAGQKPDQEGWVEFVARYKIGGKAGRIEELSHFIKAENRWLYVAAVEEEQHS